MPLQNRVTPFGELHCRAGARHVVRQPRRAFPHRRQDAHGAALGVAAMDLLRARLQGPPARRLGPLLHRAVFSRRADRARGRASALLRVPPQGRGSLCRALARGAPAAPAALRLRNGRGAAQRTPAGTGQASAPAQHRCAARRRLRRARRGGFRGARRSHVCVGRRRATMPQKPRPRGGTVDVLTPPAILAVLSAGYEPHWHPSATA